MPPLRDGALDVLRRAVRDGRFDFESDFVEVSINSRAQIIQKFRSGRDAGDEQAIPRASASDIKQVALGIVDLGQI